MIILIKKGTIFNLFLGILLVLDIIIGCFPQDALYLNIISVTIVMIAVFVKFLETGISFKMLVTFFIDIILVILTKDVSNISLLFFVSLFYLSRNDYNISTTKSLFYTSAISLCVILFLYFCFGFNRQFDTTIWRPLEEKSNNRLSLGFSHPNQFMIRFFVTFILGLLSFKHKNLYSIVFFIVAFCVKNLTESRTVYYIILLLTLTILFLSFFKVKLDSKINNKIKIFFAFSFVFFLLFSIVVSIAFAGSKLDIYLSGRLLINKRFLAEGVTLFGNKNMSLKTFDNSYIHILLTSGLIYTAVYSITWIYYFFNIQKMTLLQVLVLLGILALSFMEVCLLKYSIMILFMAITYDKSNYIGIRNCLNNNSSSCSKSN